MNLRLQWKLIIPLAILGLVQTLLSIFNVYDNFEGPWAPVLITILISAIWIGAVVMRRAPNPLITLGVVGGLYGVFAIILQQVIWNFFLENPPASPPAVGYAATIMIGVIWGAISGVVAMSIRRILARRST